MKKTLIISSLALATLGGAFAYAQAPAGGHRDHNRAAFEMSREDRQAMMDGRIAGAKAMLKLNAEQDKLWAPVEASMREIATSRMEMREQRRSEMRGGAAPAPETDPIKRMKDHATQMQKQSAAMGKLADASAPLYASLDEAQKRRFTMILRQGGGRGMEHQGMRGHHGRGGPEGGPSGGGRL